MLKKALCKGSCRRYNTQIQLWRKEPVYHVWHITIIHVSKMHIIFFHCVCQKLNYPLKTFIQYSQSLGCDLNLKQSDERMSANHYTITFSARCCEMQHQVDISKVLQYFFYKKYFLWSMKKPLTFYLSSLSSSVTHFSE
jgi:hypothetical protein